MPGYYIQDDPDQPAAIHLSIEALEKIGREVMTGFGRVPRRGAEIGGILLGEVLAGDRPVVCIDDFTPVPIQYRFGPSYFLSEADEQAFAAAVERSKGGEMQAVGFARSNTRDHQGLSAEDGALLEKHFPQRPFTVLLVRPFATRPCAAAFYTRVEGHFTTDTPSGSEFPFRKRDLMPGKASAAAANAAAEFSVTRPAVEHGGGLLTVAHARDPEPIEIPLAEPPPQAPHRSAWTWFPLSFVFLLLGVLLGFEAAGAWRNAPRPADPWDLRLAITKSGTNLTVGWDHNSAAVRSALRGSLSISDGTQQRTIDLGATELTSGTVVYAPSSALVHFRLEVFPKDNSSLAQTVDWKE